MLGDAICDFVGFGHSQVPKENSQLIFSKYGVTVTGNVEKIVSVFEAELLVNSNVEISKALDLARVKVARDFPDLDSVGLEAIVWAFSYWYK